MSRADYKEIIDEFCDLADIEDVAGVFDSGLLKVGGTPVRVEYLEFLELCRISVDLGVPASGYPPGLYRLMLESNFTHVGESLSALAIEPASGHAVLVVHVPLVRLMSDLPLGYLLGEQLQPIVDAWRLLIMQAQDDAVQATASDVGAAVERFI